MLRSIASADHIALPLYDGLKPVALLQAERLGQEYPKRGFFRLGIAPRRVMYGVEISMLTNRATSNVLTTICRQLTRISAAQNVEIRGLTVTKGTTKLELGSLVVDGTYFWRVTGGINLTESSRVITADSGTLVITTNDVILRTDTTRKFVNFSKVFESPPP